MKLAEFLKENMSEVQGAIARGWCHPNNTHKTMDVDLVMAIFQELSEIEIPTLDEKEVSGLILSYTHFDDQGNEVCNNRQVSKAICKLATPALDICHHCHDKGSAFISGSDKIIVCDKCMGSGKSSSPALERIDDTKPWEYPADYKTPLERALLINKIDSWYQDKFKGKSGYEKASVFDLIADFIMDTRTPPVQVDVEALLKVIIATVPEGTYYFEDDYRKIATAIIDYLNRKER